jgi:hypothetical protein
MQQPQSPIAEETSTDAAMCAAHDARAAFFHTAQTEKVVVGALVVDFKAAAAEARIADAEARIAAAGGGDSAARSGAEDLAAPLREAAMVAASGNMTAMVAMSFVWGGASHHLDVVRAEVVWLVAEDFARNFAKVMPPPPTVIAVVVAARTVWKATQTAIAALESASAAG